MARYLHILFVAFITKAFVPPFLLQEAPRVLEVDSHNYKHRNRWKLNFTERVGRTLLVEKEVVAPLTVFNDQDKFYNLLCYEEKEHIELLSRRCG